MSVAQRLIAGLVLSLSAMAGQAAEPPTYADLQPLLQQRCVVCHSGASAAAGLSLDSLAGLQKGGTRGAIVVSGQPAASELVKRVKGLSLPRMPLTGPPWLDEADIGRIERWIAAGLPAGAAVAPAAPVAALRPAAGQPATWAHVAPILATRCAKCHSPQGLMGPAPEGYVLNSYEAAISANDRARIVPGRPEASELVRRIKGHASPRMPFDGPPWLGDEQIRLIEDWVREGARDATGRPAPIRGGARIRLRGVMSPDGTLDGLVLPGGGRRDRMPRPGDEMELRAWLMPDGSLDIERLRRR
ncbi:c-type cytochrome domain-containing protein [Leptothrix discophora]|uniref:C-type cytochrome domain-containing protein n=1 Tax=Leptothrix discophora TaxID=89 RepID=A0ABT9FZ06_LEPDI|nr:c-type cytochrome domain-containing protein [Leptothrix discophora]MDP4299457.1 c-type cytochrome domain-containing protein [Leptothrix discophora]